jgi:hypothetical protein
MRPESPTAVVLRQGPSKVFCTIGWDLRTDEFAIGQWCRHKIYVERCDISPDGYWIVYFALNGKWQSETLGAWTAVSIAPYLRAVKLWPAGDTWGGGGAFHTPGDEPERSLNGWTDSRVVLRSALGHSDKLERDGWQRHIKPRKHYAKPVTHGWRLLKFLRKPVQHELRYDGGQIISRPGWQWADVDTPRERVVWAESGKIFAASLARDGLTDQRELFDAGPMTFTPAPAPYDMPTTIVNG